MWGQLVVVVAADVAAVGYIRGDQSRLSTAGYSSRSIWCWGRNYGTLSLFTTQSLRTHCHSWLPAKWRIARTKRAFMAARHHTEVVAACCLGVTIAVSPSIIPHPSSSLELSLEDSEEGDSQSELTPSQ
jgi:hypothetical protein